MLRPIFALALVFVMAATVLGQEAAAPPAPAEFFPLIELEVTFAEWRWKTDSPQATRSLHEVDLAALEKAGELSSLQRMQLTTVNLQKGMIQWGERRAEVTGVAARGGFGSQSSVSYSQYGTIVELTPRIDGNRILVEIDVKRSMPGLAEEGVIIGQGADGEKMRASPMPTTTLRTITSLKDGETVIVGGALFKEAERAGGQVVQLKANLIK